MKLFQLTTILSAIVLALVLSKPADAASLPAFSTCLAPTGTIKVSHDTGTHGIPGDTNTYTGKDTVYTLSKDTLMQCFCAENGSGIQTNWWKINELTESEIQILKSQGWVYIPTGAVWGLEDKPYLAKNESYSCKGSASETRVSGSSSTNNSVPSNSNPGVLGLASTGNMPFLVALFVTGILSVVIGYRLKKS